MKVEPDHARDVIRSKVIATGDVWDYLVDGSDFGADWATVGFVVKAPWNVDIDVSKTGLIESVESDDFFNLNANAANSTQVSFFRREFDLLYPDSVVDFQLALIFYYYLLSISRQWTKLI